MKTNRRTRLLVVASIIVLAVIFRPRLAHLTPPVIAARREEPRKAPAPARPELVGAGTSPRQFLR